MSNTKISNKIKGSVEKFLNSVVAQAKPIKHFLEYLVENNLNPVDILEQWNDDDDGVFDSIDDDTDTTQNIVDAMSIVTQDWASEKQVKLFNKALSKIKAVTKPKLPKDYPVGPRSGYILFGMEKRPELYESHPGINKTPGQVGTMLGAMWKKLKPSEVKVYSKRAEEDKERCITERAQYAIDNPNYMDTSDDDSLAKEPKSSKVTALSLFKKEKMPFIINDNPNMSKAELNKICSNWWKECIDQDQYKLDAKTANGTTPKKKCPKAKVKTISLDAHTSETLHSLQRNELVAILKDIGEATAGSKTILVKRILDANTSEDEVDDSLYTSESLTKLSGKELAVIAKQIGVKASGKRALIIEAIIASQSKDNVSEEEDAQEEGSDEDEEQNEELSFERYTNETKDQIKEKYPKMNNTKIMNKLKTEWGQMDSDARDPWTHPN